MIAKFLTSTACFGLIAFGGLSHTASAQTAHGIAATVNDDVITTHDLRQRVLFMVLSSGTQPDDSVLQRLQIQALQNLVDERIQLQEAGKFDLAISDAEVERSVARLAQSNNMTVAQLAEQTAQFGVSLDTLREQVRAEVAWQRIVNGRYGSRIRISDAQIDETLNRLSANADKPSFLVSEIYIEGTPDIGGMEGAMEGARAMITQLDAGAPFTALARQFSSSATAAQGGDVGWIKQGELRAELNTVLATMTPGTISEPILVPGGIYVLALRDTKVSTSDTVYRVKQFRMPGSSETELAAGEAAVRRLQGNSNLSCENFETTIDDIEGAESADMGEVKASQVNDAILQPLSNTNVGSISDPITAPNGVMALMVCERTVQGSDIPTRTEIEDRLIDQQLAQQSKRYLRDLRRSATIESR